jgi:hypothetical protein
LMSITAAPPSTAARASRADRTLTSKLATVASSSAKVSFDLGSQETPTRQHDAEP